MEEPKKIGGVVEIKDSFNLVFMMELLTDDICNIAQKIDLKYPLTFKCEIQESTKWRHHQDFVIKE